MQIDMATNPGIEPPMRTHQNRVGERVRENPTVGYYIFNLFCLSPNCSVPSTRFFAPKENGNGTETHIRISRRCGSHSADRSLCRKQIAEDLNVGFSMPSKWV